MFRLLPIRGGVHPASHKDCTSRRPIRTGLALPERLYIPLNQHAGSMALPVVKPGQQLLKGETIAIAGTGISASMHAPTSGKVVAIEEIIAPHPSGLPAPAIIIEADGDERWTDPDPIVHQDPLSLDPAHLTELVSRAGIVGMGGGIFPAGVKLGLGRRNEVKTLIINGGECEPYLTTDDRLMQERAKEIVEGAYLIRHILEAWEVLICVEDNKPEAIAALRRETESIGAIDVVPVPAIYPMGSAKQMIQAVTGKEVPAGGRSNDIGVMVHNVATVYAIQQMLRHGRPLLSRVVTVSGACVAEPQNVEVLFGTPVSHVLEGCGGLTSQPARLLMGGPMMGQILNSTAVPVIKGCSGILALDRKEVNAREPAPCIRCTRCVEACPMGLVPLEMANFTRAEKFTEAREFGLSDCILCGSCAYVCPSHIPLVQYFEFGKGELRKQKESKRKLELTKTLTEARTARQQREAEAKAAAKKARRKPKTRSASKTTETADSTE